jgi:ATP-binding cassette subfamily F protein 3
VEKVYEFGGGKVTECLGGIYEFLEKKKIESLSELERNNTASKAADSKSAPTQTENPADKPRMSYAEQRERNKMLSRAERKVKDAEADIATIEQEIADVEAKIAEGNVDNDIFTTHADLQKKLENAMSLWELATIEYDELKESIN